MKKIILRLLFLCVIYQADSGCRGQKAVAYALPDEMLPHVKVEYAKRCEQGKLLYQMNCAKCHSQKQGRKEIIPDFSPDDLRGYALRVSNARHEENMPDSLVSEEELGIIMTFLQYKKKNGKVNRSI